MPSNIERAIEEFRNRILLQEADQMREMARRWLEVEYSLEAQIGLLASELAEMRVAGQNVSQWKLVRMERYQKLLAQAKGEVNRYANWGADLIVERQARMLELGLEGSRATIRAAYMDAGQVVGGYFDLLPVEAVEYAIGYAGNGTPLGNLLKKDYPETAMKLTQALIDGTAMGRNPRVTARAMLDAMSGNLDRALTIARSEQIRAYREASRQQMIASGVVEGYIRRAALNPRTCMACLALDGTVYPTDELMEVHPNDRCFMQPMIKGLAPVQTQSGAEWFNQQDAATQQEMLGGQYYEAWISGAFNIKDLASSYVDPDWGPSVNVTPLSELIN